MSLGLALADNLLQQILQVLDVVVLEHADLGTTEPDAVSDRCVVELVGDDKGTLAGEDG